MKIEKIDENKVRITLTIDELSQREITIKDIEQDSLRAQDLFLDLIEESDLNEEFIIDGSQLFVEAASDNNNLFIVTITKIDYIPEISKYSGRDTASKRIKKKKETNTKNRAKLDKDDYSVASSIFKFSSLDNILNMCEKVKIEKVFIGTNSLYKQEDNYFLVFGNTTIKNAKFVKTFVVLSEYSEEYYSSELYKTLVTEKSHLVIAKNALQKLCKI